MNYPGATRRLQARLRLRTRERVLALAALIIVLVVLADRWVVGPYMAQRTDAEQKLVAKADLLKRYRKILANEKHIVEQAEDIASIKKSLESRFIAADTEALASAALQRIAKDMAGRSNVTVTKSSPQDGAVLFDDRQLRLLPVRFEVRTDTMGALAAFLYDLEYGRDELFFVDDLSIKAPSRRQEKGLQATLKVTAIVKITG